MLFALMLVALLPWPTNAQQQTTVLQLGTPALSARPGQTVTLAMRWNAVPMAEDYEAFVHFVDANGVQQVFNGDHAPPTGTSVWNGAVAYNIQTTTIPATAAPGTYTLRAGLYQRHAPWDRIPLTPGPGVTVDDELRYTIGTVTITGGAPQSGGPLGQDASAYVLTFSDEFDNGFDTGKWNDAIWYEDPDLANVNYGVSNGSLKIWPASTFINRTIDSDKKFSQTYGYFEMQAKLPIGRGVWPGFWLYAHPGTDRKEIDVMEAYPGGGPETGWGDANLHPTNFGLTLHQADEDYDPDNIVYATKLTDFPPYTGGVDLSAAFHTYGVKWEPSGITFYFDGQQLGPKYEDTTGYYSDPSYIVFSLWFGNEDNPTGTPDGTTPTGPGNAYEINYVRVWQFKTAAAQTVDYYGDSTVWGYKTHEGSRVAKPAPAAFAEALTGVQVRNEGVSGSTACGLLNGTDGVHPAWSTQMSNSNATTVIINHAINDQWTYGLSTYKACLSGLAQGAKSRGKRVIFETPNPTRDSGGGLETYVAAMKEVAAQHRAPVIDQYQYLLDYLSGRSPYVICPDGLHPTEEVYGMKGRYAAGVFKTLP